METIDKLYKSDIVIPDGRNETTTKGGRDGKSA